MKKSWIPNFFHAWFFKGIRAPLLNQKLFSSFKRIDYDNDCHPKVSMDVAICILQARAKPGLLYKQPRQWLTDSVSEPFPLTALQRCQAQTVGDSSSSYKIGYVIMIKNFLHPKGHQNPINGWKVLAILLKEWFFPIGGASAVEGLRSTGLPRLV